MPAKPVTLAEFATRQVGLRKAIKAIYYLVSWGMTSDAIGHPASVDEVVAHRGDSRPTVYRYRDCFMKAFPGEETPERLWRAARAHRVDEAAAIGRAMSAKWEPA